MPKVGNSKPVENKKKGFLVTLEQECRKNYVCPRKNVISKLNENELEFSVDSIRLEDWAPLFKALRLDKSLISIRLASSFLRNNPDIKSNIFNLQLVQNVRKDIRIPTILTPSTLKEFSVAIADHLSQNGCLKNLELIGFPFASVHIKELARGIHQSLSLATLSFKHCSLNQQDMQTLCHSLRNVMNVEVLSLSDCNIDAKGVEAVASLIELQATQHHGEAWKKSLRKDMILLDNFGGISRITLNNNPIGDSGVQALFSALKDNLWIRAVDLQNCGISAAGSETILDVIQCNIVLDVVDLRRNPRAAKYTEKIKQSLDSNNATKQCKYTRLPLEKTQLVRIQPQSKRSRSATSSGKREVADRTKLSRKVRSLSAGQKENGPYGILRKRSPSPKQCRHFGTSPMRNGWMKQTVTNEENTASDKESVKKLQKEIATLKKALKEEEISRKRVERRLLEVFEENRLLSSQLKSHKVEGYTLVENSVLSVIESAFRTFLEFLTLFQKERDVFLDELKNKAPSQPEPVKEVSHMTAERPSTITVKETSKLKKTIFLKQPALNLAEETHDSVLYSKLDKKPSIDISMFSDFVSKKAEEIISALKVSSKGLGQPISAANGKEAELKGKELRTGGSAVSVSTTSNDSSQTIQNVDEIDNLKQQLQDEDLLQSDNAKSALELSQTDGNHVSEFLKQHDLSESFKNGSNEIGDKADELLQQFTLEPTRYDNNLSSPGRSSKSQSGKSDVSSRKSIAKMSKKIELKQDASESNESNVEGLSHHDSLSERTSNFSSIPEDASSVSESLNLESDHDSKSVDKSEVRSEKDAKESLKSKVMDSSHLKERTEIKEPKSKSSFLPKNVSLDTSGSFSIATSDITVSSIENGSAVKSLSKLSELLSLKSQLDKNRLASQLEKDQIVKKSSITKIQLDVPLPSASRLSLVTTPETTASPTPELSGSDFEDF